MATVRVRQLSWVLYLMVLVRISEGWYKLGMHNDDRYLSLASRFFFNFECHRRWNDIIIYYYQETLSGAVRLIQKDPIQIRTQIQGSLMMHSQSEQVNQNQLSFIADLPIIISPIAFLTTDIILSLRWIRALNERELH